MRSDQGDRQGSETEAGNPTDGFRRGLAKTQPDGEPARSSTTILTTVTAALELFGVHGFVALLA
jgi:hypothetical protein